MTVSKALDAVAQSEDGDYAVLFSHGTLQIGYYKPNGVDPQQPHWQDEVYIVRAGHGTFMLDGMPRKFETGETLFVPAGVEHRFVDFSEDFETWVVFYGPSGGEAGE